jgi:hypothetical protein
VVASAVGVAASTVAHVTRHVVVVVEVAGMNPLRLYCGTAVEGPRGKAGAMACAAPPGLAQDLTHPLLHAPLPSVSLESESSMGVGLLYVGFDRRYPMDRGLAAMDPALRGPFRVSQCMDCLPIGY